MGNALTCFQTEISKIIMILQIITVQTTVGAYYSSIPVSVFVGNAKICCFPFQQYWNREFKINHVFTGFVISTDVGSNFTTISFRFCSGLFAGLAINAKKYC